MPVSRVRLISLSLLVSLAGCSLDIARLYGDASGADAGRDAAGLDAPDLERDAALDAPDGGRPVLALAFARSFPLSSPATFIAAARDGEGALVAMSSSTTGTLESVLVTYRACAFDGMVVTRDGGHQGPVALGAFDLATPVDVAVGLAGSLEIFEGRGGGEFGNASLFVDGLGALVALSAGDENGDDLVDLVIFERGTRILTMVQGSGGSFTPSAISGGMGATLLDGLTTHVDSGATLDVAALQERALLTFLGDGTGAFTAGASIPLSFDASDLTAGDLEDSGQESIVILGPQHLWVARDGVAQDLGAVGVNQRDVLIAELDGVPPRELVVSDDGLRVFHWSTGALSEETVAGVSLGVPTEMAAADVDGDGRDEIFVLTEGDLQLFSSPCAVSP